MDTLCINQWQDIKPSIWDAAQINIKELLPIQLDWFMVPLGSDPSKIFDMQNSELFDIKNTKQADDKIFDHVTDKCSLSTTNEDGVRVPEEAANHATDVDLPPGLQIYPSSQTHAFKSETSQFLDSIHYPDKVWSPKNSQGSRVYPISFLLQFRDYGYNMSLGGGKSFDFVNFENSPVGLGNAGIGMDAPFRMNYNRDIKKQQQQHHYQQQQQQAYFSGGGSGNFKKFKNGKSFYNQSPMSNFSNPWASSMSSQSDENISYEKFVRSMLNMMTPKNFEKIQSQMADRKIFSQDQLAVLVKILVEKAMLDVNYVKLYADLTVQLENNLVFDYKVEEGKRFWQWIVDSLKTRFDHRYDNEIVIPPNVTPSERLELENQKNKMYSITLGLMKFMGELSGIKFLDYNFVKYIVQKLIYEPEAESVRHAQNIEQFFTFIVAAGYGLSLNYTSFKDDIKAYFDRVNQIISKVSIPSRIKFLLLDVQDLYRSNWSNHADLGGLLSAPLPSVISHAQRLTNATNATRTTPVAKNATSAAAARNKSSTPQQSQSSKVSPIVTVYNRFENLQSEEEEDIRQSSATNQAKSSSSLVNDINATGTEVDTEDEESKDSSQFIRLVDRFEMSKSTELILEYLYEIKESKLPGKISHLIIELVSMSKDHLMVALKDMLASKIKNYVSDGILHTLSSDIDLGSIFNNPAEQLTEIVLLCYKYDALDDAKLKKFLSKGPFFADVEPVDYMCDAAKRILSESEFKQFAKSCGKM